MRFKPLAIGAAIALASTTIVLSQASAQATADLEVEQTNEKVTILAGGCETGTVQLNIVDGEGAASTVDATSIGSGRYSHLIEVNANTPAGNYSVDGTCKAGDDTLVTYNKKYFTVTAAEATATPEATTEATPEPTAEPTTDGELTASVSTVEIGKSAVVTMTDCPEGTPGEGDVYRASFEVTGPHDASEVSNSDYTDSATHEMVFSTGGATQPGKYTIDGRCEKKAGDAWSEVRTYKAATIDVVNPTSTSTDATPVPTAEGGTEPAPIGFTG